MKRPRILSARREVIEQARLLGVPGAIENRIEEAMIAGEVLGRTSRVGDTISVLLRRYGVSVLCQCSRTRSGKKAWLPLHCGRDGRARSG